MLTLLSKYDDPKDSFGLLQLKGVGEIKYDVSMSIPKCKICGCQEFPIKGDEQLCKCPICYPNEDYVDQIVKLSGEINDAQHYFFIFDTSYKMSYIIKQLIQLSSIMGDEQTVTIIGISNLTTIIYKSDLGVATLFTFKDMSEFKTSKLYAVNKKTLIDTIIPGMPTIFNITRNQETGQAINLTHVVDLLTKFTFIPCYIALFYIRRESAIITSDEALDLGSNISQGDKNIIHFIAEKGFKRLTAIARVSGGIVVKPVRKDKTFVKNLINVSSRSLVKLFVPKSVKLVVSTNEFAFKQKSQYSKYVTSQIRGLACLFKVQQINEKSSINIVEISETAVGKCMVLHRHKIDAPENQQLQREMKMKLAVYKVLKTAWQGDNILKLMQSLITDDMKKGTAIDNYGVNPDEDIYSLYQVLTKVGYVYNS